MYMTLIHLALAHYGVGRILFLLAAKQKPLACASLAPANPVKLEGLDEICCNGLNWQIARKLTTKFGPRSTILRQLFKQSRARGYHLKSQSQAVNSAASRQCF